MNGKRKIIFQIIVVVFIISVVFLTALLNSSAFVNSCVEAGGESAASILDTIVDRVEYGLRYGKSLRNYYGIEDVFEETARYCDADACYVTDTEGNILYGDTVPEDIDEVIERMNISGEHRSVWEDDKTQHVLIRIDRYDETAGFFGIDCMTEKLRSRADPYAGSMLASALIISALGAVFFILLFSFVKHGYDTKKLRNIILADIILINLISLVVTGIVLKRGYTDIADSVAQALLERSAGDMDSLIGNGVYYSDILNPEDYFNDLTRDSRQVSSIRIAFSEEENSAGIPVKALAQDEKGDRAWLYAETSDDYVSGMVTKALISILVTTITAVMIALEILIFLLGVLVDEKRERLKKRTNTQDLTLESLGVVRGLSFFFAAFRYMSAAFMSIVLTEIYRPVILLGMQIPYEMLMSLPLSSQIFISMITSYVSGNIISKKGWKNVTLTGVLIMSAGTFCSSFSKDPVTFIIAQMIMGTGLGLAKMGVDLYAVDVSSEEDMNTYTANANASIIVGFSCSASLGAMIASVFGYQGAYLVMSVMGLGVFIVLYFFGMNIDQRVLPEETVKKEESKTGGHGPIDIRFAGYILLVVIPYFFIMMFVDYFFPVYANSRGITTDVIGYVMLVYGMTTAYLGTYVCEKVTKRHTSEFLMSFMLIALGGSFFLLGNAGGIWYAILIVVLIGLCDGIMPSIQLKYVYNLPLSQKLGFSRVEGIEGVFSSLIGAVAPVVFSAVMMYGTGGLKIVAGLIVACAVGFIVINKVAVKGEA